MATVPSEDTSVVGGKITAAWANADIRDAVNFLLAPPRVSVYHSANITPATSTLTVQPWDTELYDSDVMHDTVTNNSRLIAKTAGMYHCVFTAQFAANATGTRRLNVRKNAAGSGAGGTQVADIYSGAASASTSSNVFVAFDLPLAANDYLEMFVWQNSGGGLVVGGGAQATFASMRWVASS